MFRKLVVFIDDMFEIAQLRTCLFIRRLKLEILLRKLRNQSRSFDELTVENRNLVSKQGDLIRTYGSGAMLTNQCVKRSEQSHVDVPLALLANVWINAVRALGDLAS